MYLSVIYDKTNYHQKYFYNLIHIIVVLSSFLDFMDDKSDYILYFRSPQDSFSLRLIESKFQFSHSPITLKICFTERKRTVFIG